MATVKHIANATDWTSIVRPATGCMNRKSIKAGDTARTYAAFIKRLQILGCVQCPGCRDYVYLADHACSTVSRVPDCHAMPLAA